MTSILKNRYFTSIFFYYYFFLFIYFFIIYFILFIYFFCKYTCENYSVIQLPLIHQTPLLDSPTVSLGCLFLTELNSKRFYGGFLYFLPSIFHTPLYKPSFPYLFMLSTLVISKSKGLSEILLDIRTSTYQICRIEEKNRANNHISQMNM